MTNLTMTELKAICTERNITVTGDKRLKATYIDAIEMADAPDFANMTEEECEIWMENATGIKIGTTQVTATQPEAIEVETETETEIDFSNTTEEECEIWMEQTTGIKIGTT